MEFHDVLHGLIKVEDEHLKALFEDLLNSPEIHRLRNMRQMNFDVPLIQELGRSRRLPHSIGVVHIAIKLSHKANLNREDKKKLLSAALLHDAAIPPYGHLVESEFKQIDKDFNHERILRDIVYGTMSERNAYEEIVPGKTLKLSKILDKHGVDAEAVIELVCPTEGKRSPISADIDIDNIDNVHRMAIMLGWTGVRENLEILVNSAKLDADAGLVFAGSVEDALEKWLDYRQKIYTMIIGHRECIPHNALQADLARLAVKEKILSVNEWFITEPEFEERLRHSEATRNLARQLISGCEYTLVDYVWMKNFASTRKLTNAAIAEEISEKVEFPGKGLSYFVWNEKGLVSRKISWFTESGEQKEVGRDSASCMVALVKKTPGVGKPPLVQDRNEWRKGAAFCLAKILGVDNFEVSFPEDYTGDFYGSLTDEFNFGY